MFIFFDSSFFIFPFVQARFLHIHIHTRTSVTSVTSVTSKRLSITRTTHTCDSVSYTHTRTVKKMFFFFILVLYSRQPCSLSVFLFYSCPVPRCAQHAQWPLPLHRNSPGTPTDTDIRTPTQGPALLLHVLHITLAASLFLSATHTE